MKAKRQFYKSTGTVSSCIDLFKFPSQKQERKGGWGPSFASNLTLSFRVLIRPYWTGQVYSLIKDTQIDLDYKNQNVRGRQALKKGQSLIFMYCSQHFCTILRNLVYCFCAFEGPRRRRGSCWEERKRIVFPHWGVIDLHSRQINDFSQKGNRKKNFSGQTLVLSSCE